MTEEKYKEARDVFTNMQLYQAQIDDINKLSLCFGELPFKNVDFKKEYETWFEDLKRREVEPYQKRLNEYKEKFAAL